MKKMALVLPSIWFGMCIQAVIDGLGKEQPAYTPDIWFLIITILFVFGNASLGVMFYNEWKR